MKKNILGVVAVLALFSLSSCFGDHNKAPSKGINLENTRIYGEKGAPAKHLANQYPDPSPQTLERIQKLREKMFPR